MQGTILGYRRGRHTQDVNQMLVEIEGVDSKGKVDDFLGKKLVWESPGGKRIEGEIIASHGNKGVARVKFQKNLPGQSIGTKVEILD